ncbi:MAG: TVP38/TMEM64 family protein [Gammaproteobacteria bacterium]|jgi:uncharacterized membrane protein YdjX (TVP38/TMEM64 family)
MNAAWRSWSLRTLLGYALCAALIITAVVFIGEEIAQHVAAFETWLAGLGPWALLIAVVLYAMLSTVFVPDMLLGIIAGASFGFTQGLMVAAAGCVLGAVLQYWLGRNLLKPTIDRMLDSRPSLKAVQRAVLLQEFKLQALLRLTPLNRALTSYLFGAAGVRFTPFLMACVALAPHLCLEVYFGYAGKHLAKNAGESTSSVLLHDAMIFGGLGVALLVMVQVSRVAREAVEAVTETPLESGL